MMRGLYRAKEEPINFFHFTFSCADLLSSIALIDSTQDELTDAEERALTEDDRAARQVTDFT